MVLMSNMGEYQTKDSIDKIIWRNYTAMSPEKHDSSREEENSSLPADKWAVAESQRGMTQDKVKIVWQGATLRKMDIYLRER